MKSKIKNNVSLNPERSLLEIAGLTLIEILIVIAIMGFLATLLAGILSNFKSVQSLQVGSTAISSTLIRARSESVAGVDGVPHGVHFASTTLTIFEGGSYNNSSANNVSIQLLGNLTVISMSIGTTSNNIIFDQLTGTTGEPGTVVVQVGSDDTQQKTITVSAMGIVSVH